MTTYEHTLRKDGQIRQFSILRQDGEWRVVDSADGTVLRAAAYHDWHRVERARRVFAIECSALQAEGWTDSPSHSTKR